MEDRLRTAITGEPGTASGWAESEARDLADAARQRVHDAQQYATEVKEYARGAVDQTREYVHGARGYVEGAVRQARDKVVAYREGGFGQVRHDLAGYTREQPMAVLLVGIGAGLVLGWLSAVGRR